jgi:predicted nuclease of restriction endonuclease-like RecB superfamily
MSKTTCPKCGNPKKPWFELCFDCSEKEKQKPTCEVCGISVPEGHYLCTEHWKQKQEEEKKINQINYVKDKKVTDFKDKFEGKYYFNSMKVKSKSELLLSYFFEANGLHPRYEDRIELEGKEYRPDFIIEKGEYTIIIEHFGGEGEEYNGRKDEKINAYKKKCKEDKNWFFIWTDENDMFNLKDKLGKKLNETPLKQTRWK